MKIDFETRARTRLTESSTAQEKLKKKVYQLRRLVAGDQSMFGGAGVESEDNDSGRIDDLYDFIVNSIAAGRSNRLLEGVKTLLMQASFKFPEIEFEDLGAELAAVNSGMCKVLLGDRPKGCAALDQMKRAMLDYIVGGMGWSRLGFDPYTDRPWIKFADTLDMSWDQRVHLPTDIRWASCLVRETAGFWAEYFGDAKIAKLRGNKFDTDSVLGMQFYYDLDSQKGRGTHYVFYAGEAGEPMVLVHEEKNPFFYTNEEGVEVPFLPFEPMYFLALPSTRSPVGIVEMMMADQIAIWQSEDVLGKTAARMTPHYMAEEGALSDEVRKRWERGEVGELITFKTGKTPPTVAQPGDVSASLLQRLQYHERRIVAQAGQNPYISGSPVSGTKYASEVQEISRQSRLTVDTVSKDNAVFWVRTVRKFLMAVSTYGDFPLTVRYDGVPISFDAANPVKNLIVPDADIVIREDTTVFKPKSERVQEAMMKLQVAQSLAQMYPNALKLAFEDVLRAMGEQNIATWMEAPEAAMMQDPAQMGAESSTAM